MRFSVDEKAQGRKALTTKPDDPGLITRPHIVGEERVLILLSCLSLNGTTGRTKGWDGAGVQGRLYRSGKVLNESVHHLVFGVLTQMRLSPEREKGGRVAERNSSLKMSSSFHLNSDDSNTAFKRYINSGILKFLVYEEAKV